MTLLIGDCRETLKGLAAGSVDCIVTSPPYWNLRDYGVDNQIGLEATPAEYIATMLEVFRECKRVLADHGTCWINLGTSYAQSGQSFEGWKPKDEIDIPFLVAEELRKAGWYKRQTIIWHKPSPMPSSVRDRCTTSHEYIFLLSKSPRYYYDWYGVSEETSVEREGVKFGGNKANGFDNRLHSQNEYNTSNRRNKRSVWTITSESYKDAHFATYPKKLVQPCILAGCPETVCLECGKPWVRHVATEREPTRPANNVKVRFLPDNHDNIGDPRPNLDPERHCTEYVDKGFFADCECGIWRCEQCEQIVDDPSMPHLNTYNGIKPLECHGEVLLHQQTRKGVVLDPFLGSGTTAQVAQDLGRDWVGCELNEEYAAMIDTRTEQRSLF